MAEINADRVKDVDLYGAVKRYPYPFYEEWSKEPPFYIMEQGHPQLVCVRLEDSRPVLSDFARFSSVKRPYPGTKGFYFFNSIPSVTDSDPPVHTRRRRLMAPAVTPRRLAMIEERVGREIDRLVDALEDKPAFDLVDDFTAPLALATLLGIVCDIPSQDWTIFTDLIAAQRAAFAELSGGSPEKETAYRATFQHAWDYCGGVIRARTENPTDDLVSNMIAAMERGDELTAEELFATLVLLYSAGIGALTSTPAWSLWRLARHPDQNALLRQDLSLVTGAVTESLRMDPSSYTSLRFAVGDFEHAGVQVLDGMPVHTLSAGGNFDEARFPDALRFDITRPTDWKTLSTFGHGVHHCIGNALGRMTSRFAVEKIVRRFPNLRLEDPDFIPEIEGVLKQRAPVAIPMRHD